MCLTRIFITIYLIVLLESCEALSGNDSTHQQISGPIVKNLTVRNNTDLKNLFSTNEEKINTTYTTTEKTTYLAEVTGVKNISTESISTHPSKNVSPRITYMEGGDGVTVSTEDGKSSSVRYEDGAVLNTFKDTSSENGTLRSSTSGDNFTSDPTSTSLSDLEHETGNPNGTAQGGRIVPRKGVGLPFEQESGSGESNESSESTKEKYFKSALNKSCECCSNSTFTPGTPNLNTSDCKMCCNSTSDKQVPNDTAGSNITRPDNSSMSPNSTSAVSSNVKGNYFNISEHGKENKNSSFSDQISKPHPSRPTKNKKPLTTDIVYESSKNSTHKKLLLDSKTSKGSDHIVPIVGIILAIPLVIVLAIIVFKKGSEFWERRHYRRMDFLIDGMYNE